MSLWLVFKWEKGKISFCRLGNREWWRRRKRRKGKKRKTEGAKEEGEGKEGGISVHSVQVRGNLRQPQWAIKQMGNLVMPIKSGGREGKNREMKQNVILIRTTWLPSPSSSPMGQHCCHIDSLQSLSSSWGYLLWLQCWGQLHKTNSSQIQTKMQNLVWLKGSTSHCVRLVTPWAPALNNTIVWMCGKAMLIWNQSSFW